MIQNCTAQQVANIIREWFRLVCSMLALNPSVTRIPTEDLQYAIDLIATLVLATRIPKPEG